MTIDHKIPQVICKIIECVKNRSMSPLPFSFITSRYHWISISEAYNLSCIFSLWV